MKFIYKLNNYVKELLYYPILPNGTNIGGLYLSLNPSPGREGLKEDWMFRAPLGGVGGKKQEVKTV
jgi:hypothetical protein